MHEVPSQGHVQGYDAAEGSVASVLALGWWSMVSETPFALISALTVILWDNSEGPNLVRA